MVSLPDIPSESALARLFYEERGHGEATWFSLPGGATLFEAGEPADHSGPADDSDLAHDATTDDLTTHDTPSTAPTDPAQEPTP